MKEVEKSSKLGSRQKRSFRSDSQSSNCDELITSPIISPQSTSGAMRNSRSASKTSLTNDDESDEQPSGHTSYTGKTSKTCAAKSPKVVDKSTDKSRRTREESFGRETTIASTQSSGLGAKTYIALLLGALAAAGAVKIYKENDANDRSAKNWRQLETNFENDLERLKLMFPAQLSSTWKDIRIGLTQGMKENPRRPGLLLLLSTTATVPSSKCLYTRILELVTPVFTDSDPEGRNIINGADLTNTKQEKDKLYAQLDSSLRQFGVALLTGMEHLSGDNALVLHGLADDSNAPYKNSVLVMSLQVDELKPGCDVTGKAEQLLFQQWMDIGEDKATALINRVTYSVIQVEPETDQALETACSNGDTTVNP